MTWDRKDFGALTNDAKAQAAAAHRQPLQMLTQAAVAAESLTHDPKWDVFLQYIQGAIEKLDRVREAHLRVLSNPAVLDHQTMMAAKVSAIECASMIAAYQTVITLPVKIMEDGAKAVDLLESIKINEPDTDAA